MGAIGQIIAGTPWWVWVLFLFLLWIGIRALKTSVAPFWRLLILPAVFFVWGIAGIATRYPITATSLGLWAVAFALGGGLGLLISANIAVRADKTRGLIEIPGNKFTLVLILVIFATKYAFGVLQGMQPGILADPRYFVADLGVSGLLAGMWTGRLAGLWRKYRAAPSEDLSTS
jgi:hypothetical protein